MKKRIMYWLIALGVVLALIFLFFGIISTAIIESHIRPHFVLAPIIGMVGLGILLTAGRMDLLLNKLVRKPGEANVRVDGESWGPRLLGSSFLAGAFLYGCTGNVDILVGFFAGSVLILRVVDAAQRHLFRKHLEGPNKSNLN